MIVFFHTGCPDCRKELPVLQKIYTDYGQRIRMVCISREESSAEIVRYWDENHLTLPYSAQENRTVYYQFAKSGIPRVYVIDKELVIRSVFTDNPLASYEDLAEAYRNLFVVFREGKIPKNRYCQIMISSLPLPS